MTSISTVKHDETNDSSLFFIDIKAKNNRQKTSQITFEFSEQGK